MDRVSRKIEVSLVEKSYLNKLAEFAKDVYRNYSFCNYKQSFQILFIKLNIGY